MRFSANLLTNEDSGFAANEYEHEPVPEHKAQDLKSFLSLIGFPPDSMIQSELSLRSAPRVPLV